jgi:two-component system NtrC family response regulator
MEDADQYSSNLARTGANYCDPRNPGRNAKLDEQQHVVSADTGDPFAADDLVSRMIVGKSPAIQQVIKLIRQVAPYPSTMVLLQGESGTGKEVVARAIHELSRRAAYQFVPINCAAIPETLLECELFGVEAGAYTDAKVSRQGYIWRAHRGSLFLDEIGSMPLPLQSKLLRFLETLRFHRVGGTREMHVDLRVISATNSDLQMAVAQRRFRDDLFYRLNVVTIYLPPLRDRQQDIEPLVDHFLSIHNAGSTEPLSVSPEAMDYLQQYSWPGNIRELRSVIERGQILCDHNVIEPKDLPLTVRNAGKSALLHLREVQQQLHLPPDGLDLPTFLRDIETVFIQEALERCNGNKVRAAALLHLTRDQLRYRLQK